MISIKKKITIRPTVEDTDNILTLTDPGKTPTDAIRKGLKYATKFKQLRNRKIANMIGDIALFEITDDDLQFDTQKKVKEGISRVLMDLWRDTKITKQGKLKRLIQTYKEKYT